MKKINIGKKEVIHFIGIGGITMSGLAQIMKIMGFKVQGSDLGRNKNTENCKKIGIKIFLGHKRPNISDLHEALLKVDGQGWRPAQNLRVALMHFLAGVMS